jgi:hypothetical protein
MGDMVAGIGVARDTLCPYQTNTFAFGYDVLLRLLTPFNVWLACAGVPMLCAALFRCHFAEGGGEPMPLINIVIVLIVVGILLWLINRFIPMQGTIKSILNAVVVICVVLWLLNVFGVLAWLPHIRVGS